MAALAIRYERGVGQIQSSLHTVAETARRLDTRCFEVDARPKVRAELVPAVYGVLDDAVTVLGQVLQLYDQPQEERESPASSGLFHSLIDDMVEVPGPDPRQRIADISFMARWELDRKRSCVNEASHGIDDWRLIAECCSARRRVVKAATGVERALSEVESLPSLFADLYQTEKQRAVETRAAYYSFVRGLSAVEQCNDLERGLRLAGTGIAQLIGRTIYEELRVDDRRSIRELQARLFNWLRAPRDEREGRRLLSELVAFGSLLMEVNRRPPLIDHDLEVLEKLLRAIEQPATNKQTFYQLLVTIRGRDPKLDALINAHADLIPQVWRRPAEQTLVRLREQVTGT